MKALALLAILLILVTFVVLGPLCSIWALNTLFHLAIPFTISTWAAMLVLHGLLTIKVRAIKNK